jgi:hypothetical protein
MQFMQFEENRHFNININICHMYNNNLRRGVQLSTVRQKKHCSFPPPPLEMNQKLLPWQPIFVKSSILVKVSNIVNMKSLVQKMM